MLLATPEEVEEGEMIKMFFGNERARREFCKMFGLAEDTVAINGSDLYDYFDARRDDASKMNLSLDPPWYRKDVDDEPEPFTVSSFPQQLDFGKGQVTR